MNCIRPISALLLVVCVAVSLSAQEARHATKLPAATFCDLAAIPLPPALPREIRHEKSRRYGMHTRDGRGARSEGVELPHVTTDATIAPPSIASAFGSGWSILVDPADSTGAAGKKEVLTASNFGFIVHARNGDRIAEATLNQFWNAAPKFLEFYDPRVSYDAAADRWIAVSIRDERAVMIGVSGTGDAVGVWHRYEIPIVDCDFSRLALTRDTIVVATAYGYTGYSEVLSLSKSELYAGVQSPTVRSTLVRDDAMLVDAPDSTIEYIAYSGDSELIVERLDRANRLQKVFDAGFSWSYPFDDYAPQAGSTLRLSIGYGDVQSAVYRGGWIYAVHRIGTSTRAPDGNALVWWKVDPTGVKMHEVGVIDSPTGTWYAYPSMNVNHSSGMLISFCTLSASSFPSASFVYRDPAGRVSTPAVIHSGDKAVTGSGRWGDYTTVAEDPNGRDFWIGQIYATRTNWETWWANVKIAPTRARGVRH